jgi:hypothetical protein
MDCALERTNYLTREMMGYQLDSTAAISVLQTLATGLGRSLVRIGRTW